GGNQRRSTSEEGVIHDVSAFCVVHDRSAHAFDGLLRTMLGIGVFDLSAARVAVGDLPKGGLFAIAGPVACLTLLDRVPAGFVLPVVVAARDYQPLLGPDDLRADVVAGLDQTLSHLRGENASMPDVGDVSIEEANGLGPIEAIIILDFPQGAGGVSDLS